MDYRKLHDRLRQRTGEALRRQAGLAAGREGLAVRPAAGDLLLMPESAELGIEWAVLATAGDDSRRVLAVPADTVPMIGSADVEVPADEDVGPLSLRCRFGVWVQLDEDDLNRREGSVGEGYVTAALEKHRALAAGKLRGTASERDVDGDPEYREWVEELAAARGALERARSEPRERRDKSGVAAQLDEPAGSPKAVPFAAPPEARPTRKSRLLALRTDQEVDRDPGYQDWQSEMRPRRGVRRQILGMAASVFAASTLFLVVGMRLERQERAELAEELAEARVVEIRQAFEDRIAELEAERSRTAGELARTAQEHEQAVADLRRRLEDAEEAARASETESNLPFAVLAWTGPERGDEEKVEFPADAERLILIVSPSRLGPEDASYRLEISRRGDEDPFLTFDPLHNVGLNEMTVLLSRSALPAGRYDLRLYRLGAEGDELIDRKKVQVVYK